MKETLSAEDRAAIVKYRMEKAFSTFEEAKFCAEGKLWNLTVNRLYYACYYAASALLIKDKIEANTHAGVKTQFSRLYILTEKNSSNSWYNVEYAV